MALMLGTGPFSRRPAGTFNFSYEAPAHRLYLEPTARRIRVVVAGQVVADSTDARLLHETGLMPVYYVPWDDVREELLVASDHTTHCPFKGDASYLNIEVEGDVRENAVWAYPTPLQGAPPLADLVAFQWDAVDAWYEEHQRLVRHPRDPYHRIDVIPSDRHVVLRLDGTVVADSQRPTILFETGLPPRYYLPEADVDTDRLEPSDTQTTCPYKGTTTAYHSVRVGDTYVEDGIWVYGEPNPEAAGVAGLYAFYDDRFDVAVDADRFQLP